MYSFKIRGSHLARNISYAAEFIVHVLPGRPTRLCIWTEFEGSQISNTNDFQPQPRLLLLDPAGNIFQPLRSDKRLDTSRYSFLAEELESSTMETLNVTMNYEKRRYIARTKVGVGEWTDLPMLPRGTSMVTHYLSPVPDYVEVSGIGVLQIQFKELRVKGTYGEQYHFVFRSDYLRSSANSIPLLLKLCSSYEYATEGTDTCSACPSGFDNCIGGSTSTCFSCNGTTALNVTTGYWRYDEWSTFAYKCPSSSCLGDTELGSCMEGYVDHSALCATCADGYARDFLGKCVECPSIWVSSLLFALTILFVALVFFVFVTLALRGQGRTDDDQSFILLLKVFMNFVQVVGMLGEFEINFPGYVKSYFGYISAASGASGISISPVNCMFPSTTFLSKLIAQLLMPPVVLSAIAVVLVVIHKKDQRAMRRMEEKISDESISVSERTKMAVELEEKIKDAKPLHRVFNTTSMIMIFLLYQTIVTQCVKLFRCLDIRRSGDETSVMRVLVADAKVECTGTEYEVHVAIALLGFAAYGLLLPLLTMSLVLRVSRVRGWVAANSEFAFLIKGFRMRYWFWEFVIVSRKVFIRLLLSAVHDAVLQALVGMWGLTALFVFHAYTQPYVKRLINHAEALSIMALIITLNVGLLFRSTDSGEGCDTLCGVVTVFLIAVISTVLCFFAVYAAKLLYDRLVEQFGVDSFDGVRRFSMRNVLKASHFKLSKGRSNGVFSFTSYTPRFRDSKMATDVLGKNVVDELENALEGDFGFVDVGATAADDSTERSDVACQEITRTDGMKSNLARRPSLVFPQLGDEAGSAQELTVRENVPSSKRNRSNDLGSLRPPTPMRSDRCPPLPMQDQHDASFGAEVSPEADVPCPPSDEGWGFAFSGTAPPIALFNDDFEDI